VNVRDTMWHAAAGTAPTRLYLVMASGIQNDLKRRANGNFGNQCRSRPTTPHTAVYAVHASHSFPALLEYTGLTQDLCAFMASIVLPHHTLSQRANTLYVCYGHRKATNGFSASYTLSAAGTLLESRKFSYAADWQPSLVTCKGIWHLM
jgi:hypothetical protein